MKGKGGRLSISLEKLSLEVVLSRQLPELSICDYALIRVVDTGHGMSAEIMERIFEPYFTTKAAGEGTGLGLAVAHGIIANHGGTITVTSDLGQGTRFEIFLPIVDSNEVMCDEVVTSSRIDLRPELQARIVVIDDEPSLVEVGRDTLQHLGYDVIGFVSSIEAFEYINRNLNEVDLIITDQTMPNMTGDVLIKKVKALRENLPIILCTGYSAVVDAHGADRLGVAAFLNKPYSIVQLCSTVKTVLGG
jgi:CheY-like chemotaxis protein